MSDQCHRLRAPGLFPQAGVKPMKPRLLGVHTLNAAPKTKDAGRVAGFLFSQAVVGAAQGAPERDAPERFPRDFKGRKRGRERWSILLIGKEGGGEKKRFPGKRAGRSGRRKKNGAAQPK